MEHKVITFPKSGRPGDEKLVADIRKAWRRLARTIKVAQSAGLTVETEFYEHRPPVITRKL